MAALFWHFIVNFASQSRRRMHQVAESFLHVSVCGREQKRNYICHFIRDSFVLSTDFAPMIYYYFIQTALRASCAFSSHRTTVGFRVKKFIQIPAQVIFTGIETFPATKEIASFNKLNFESVHRLLPVSVKSELNELRSSIKTEASSLLINARAKRKREKVSLGDTNCHCYMEQKPLKIYVNLR